MKFNREGHSRISRQPHIDLEDNESSGDVIHIQEVARKWMPQFLRITEQSRTTQPPLYYSIFLDTLIDIDPEEFKRLPKPENGFDFFREQLLKDPLHISARLSFLVRMYPESKEALEHIYSNAIASFYRLRQFDFAAAAGAVIDASGMLFLHSHDQQRVRKVASPAIRTIFELVFKGEGNYAPPNQYSYFRDLLLLQPSLRPQIQAYIRAHAVECRQVLRKVEQNQDVLGIFTLLRDFAIIQADEAEVLPNGQLKLTKKNRFTSPQALPPRPTF